MPGMLINKIKFNVLTKKATAGKVTRGTRGTLRHARGKGMLASIAILLQAAAQFLFLDVLINFLDCRTPCRSPGGRAHGKGDDGVYGKIAGNPGGDGWFTALPEGVPLIHFCEDRP